MEQKYTKFLFGFCKKAGSFALKEQKKVTSSIKSDQSIVTEVDLAISKMFYAEIEKFPDSENHFVIDEEFVKPLSEVKEKLEKAKYTWIIDPIDGTTMYFNGLQFWSISIGVFKDGKPWLGMIYMPALKELIYFDGKKSYFVQNPFTKSEKTQVIEKPKKPLVFKSAMVCRLKKDVLISRTGFGFFDVGAASIYCSYVILDRVKSAFFSKSIKIWDLAGALPMIKSLGLDFFDSDTGEKIEINDFKNLQNDWKFKRVIVLCGPENVKRLLGLVEYR